MNALYITSFEVGTGKTAVAAGLSKHLLDSGKKIAFLKPVIGQEAEDGDAAFMKRVFNLDVLSPVVSDKSQLAGKVKEAYARISPGKDMVIVESIYGQGIAEALDARVIVVEGYTGLSEVRDYQDLGKRLLGVVMNKVPRSRLKLTSDEMSARLGKTINILGVLPEDRALFTLTVNELAQSAQGEILNNPEQSNELVENVMLGAMSVDPGPLYYGRKANKAVVVRGDRPDMQLAALETPTRCLVLSGNKTPIPSILSRAKERKVPVIQSKDDITAIVASIEEAMDQTRFHQEKKLARLYELMAQHFNFGAVDRGLGLAK